MPGEYTFFSGSKLLLPLAGAVGVTVDKVNFVFCQCVSLPLSLLFYHYLSVGKVSRNVRLGYNLCVGLAVLLFCFGEPSKHIFAHTLINYVFIRFAPTNLFIRLYSYFQWVICP